MNRIIPIKALKDNYIWAICNDTSKRVWIVDPGEAEPVIDFLETNLFKLSGILITHHHHDHTGGIAELIDYAGILPIYGSYKSSISYITNKVKENDEISLGEIYLKALEIPGHTLDHTAYYNDEIIFTGDTLFSAGCGKIFEGTPEQMFESLNKITSLPDYTEIYCGHEYTLKNLQFAEIVEPTNLFIKEKIHALKNERCTLPSLLRDEKKMNPFLRCHEASVVKSLEKHTGTRLTNPVDVFAALREWKNNF